MLSLGFAPCLISSHPSAPLGALLSIDTKVPKKSLRVRRIWKPNFPFAGEKGKYRLPMRLQRFRLLISLLKKHQSAIIFKPHSVMVLSQRKLKRTVSLSFSLRISCGGFICSTLIFSFSKLSVLQVRANKKAQNQKIRNKQKKILSFCKLAFAQS